MRARAEFSRGFTLLEVLIGLLVLALALVALTRTAASQVNAFADMRERTFASWLARDVLAQTKLSNAFPDPGTNDGQRLFAGRNWRYQVIVESTDVTTIHRIDVHVMKNAGEAPIAEISGLVTNELVP